MQIRAVEIENAHVVGSNGIVGGKGESGRHSWCTFSLELDDFGGRHRHKVDGRDHAREVVRASTLIVRQCYKHDEAAALAWPTAVAFGAAWC